MKTGTKLMLLNSNKPTSVLTSKKYTSDDEIEALFEPLIRELNEVIRFTDAYKYGGFRFRIIVDSDQVPTIMLADTEWHNLFGKRIRELCRDFNIHVDYQDWNGFYFLYPLNEDRVDIEFDGSAWIRRIPYAIDNHKYEGR